MALSPRQFYTAITDTLAASGGEETLAQAVHIPDGMAAPRPAFAEIINFWKRLGAETAAAVMADAGSGLAEEALVNALISVLAEAVNRTPAQITAVLNVFTARTPAGTHPLCGKIPRCQECGLRKHCDHGNAPLPALPSLPLKTRIEQQLDMSVAECLAVVLGGNNPSAGDIAAAQKVLTHFGGIVRALQSGYGDFAGLRDIGPKRAARLAAAARIYREAVHAAVPEKLAMRSGADFFAYYQARLGGLAQETFRVVLLDNQNRFIRDEEIVKGTLSGLMVEPRAVLAPAVRENAAAVAFIHNHPSGVCTPSAADIATTRQLCAGARLLAVRVLDHVIIGAQTYYSFADAGLID